MHVAPSVPALELERVSFTYRGGPPAVEDVSLAVEQGAFLGIAGPNGGGKTTLLRLALGLERPLTGVVRLFGAAPGTRGLPRVGYVSQRAQIASGTPVTVRNAQPAAGQLTILLDGAERPITEKAADGIYVRAAA